MALAIVLSRDVLITMIV